MDYREGMQILRQAGLHAPSIVCLHDRYFVFSRTRMISSGGSVDEALDAGGFLVAENAPRDLFVAYNHEVVRGSEVEARAKSTTMAKRIANALNEYIPSEKKY